MQLTTEVNIVIITSCARGDTICLRPLQVDNIFVFNRQVAPVPAYWLFKTSASDLESGVRVTCDVGYLYANLSLPRPLCSRVRPGVRDRRQTDSLDRRQTKASLNASTLWGRRHNDHTMYKRTRRSTLFTS